MRTRSRTGRSGAEWSRVVQQVALFGTVLLSLPSGSNLHGGPLSQQRKCGVRVHCEGRSLAIAVEIAVVSGGTRISIEHGVCSSVSKLLWIAVAKRPRESQPCWRITRGWCKAPDGRNLAVMVSVAAIHSIAKATEYGVYSMISGGTMWESGSCGTTQKRRTLKMTKKGSSRQLHHVVSHTDRQPNSEKVPDESYALAHTPVTQEENTPASHQRCRVL